MEITIPKKYRSKFKPERRWIKPKGGGDCIVQDPIYAFILRWKKHTLLITNRKMKNVIIKRLDEEIGKETKEKGFLRLLRADIHIVEMQEDGTIEIPDFLEEWLGEGEYGYKREDLGIVVSTKEQ